MQAFKMELTFRKFHQRLALSESFTADPIKHDRYDQLKLSRPKDLENMAFDAYSPVNHIFWVLTNLFGLKRISWF